MSDNENLTTNDSNENLFIESEVTAVPNESGDIFITSQDIDSSKLPNSEEIEDFDPIVVLNIKPSRFKRAIKKFNGVSTFAIILSIAIILAAVFSVGYFVGKNQSLDKRYIALDERPKGDVLNTSEVYDKVNPSVVGIIIYNTGGMSSMVSGVIYSKDGYIVTNDHIYKGIPNAKFKIYTSDGKEHSAIFIAGDARSDLAVLKTDSPNLTPATFGNSDGCIIGEGAVAVGRPAGATNASNISKGVICGLNVRVRNESTSYSESFIQTDTAINPGSSGGALCNMYGQVIGITSSKLVGAAYEGVGYAIPTTRMKEIVDSLIKNKCVVTRARVGISYNEIDSVLSELNDIPQGLYVASVDKSSGFAKTLKKDDVIVEVNGKKATTETVLDIVDSLLPGENIEFTVYRKSNNKTFKVSAKLLADKGESSYVTK